MTREEKEAADEQAIAEALEDLQNTIAPTGAYELAQKKYEGLSQEEIAALKKKEAIEKRNAYYAAHPEKKQQQHRKSAAKKSSKAKNYTTRKTNASVQQRRTAAGTNVPKEIPLKSAQTPTDGEELESQDNTESQETPRRGPGRPPKSESQGNEGENNEESPRRGRPPKVTPTGTAAAESKASKKSPRLNKADNTVFIAHALELSSLPEVIWNDLESVKRRATEYFQICIKNDMRPTYVGLALAFGLSRDDLSNLRGGFNSVGATPEALRVLEKAVAIVDAQIEDYMINGLIAPVSGIFLMKNNFGYKDTSEQIITTTHYEASEEALLAEANNLPTNEEEAEIIDVTPPDEDEND